LTVVLTDPNSVAQAVTMIRELGAMVGAAERALGLADEIIEAIEGVPAGPRVPVYVGVWHNPMMGLGSESYGHSLVEICGGRNVLAARPRYPETTLAELSALAPELILLPDEPFPFDESHLRHYGTVAPARLIDGKLMWWYGPRIPEAIHTLSAIVDAARSP
jgi:ABC-type Fe3+-hydroxamate transport system substrate-binding protein